MQQSTQEQHFPLRTFPKLPISCGNLFKRKWSEQELPAFSCAKITLATAFCFHSRNDAKGFCPQKKGTETAFAVSLCRTVLAQAVQKPPPDVVCVVTPDGYIPCLPLWPCHGLSAWAEQTQHLCISASPQLKCGCVSPSEPKYLLWVTGPPKKHWGLVQRDRIHPLLVISSNAQSQQCLSPNLPLWTTQTSHPSSRPGSTQYSLPKQGSSVLFVPDTAGDLRSSSPDLSPPSPLPCCSLHMFFSFSRVYFKSTDTRAIEATSPASPWNQLWEVKTSFFPIPYLHIHRWHYSLLHHHSGNSSRLVGWDKPQTSSQCPHLSRQSLCPGMLQIRFVGAVVS